MQDLNVALVTIGGLTLVLSLVAGLLRNRVYVLSEPIAAVLLGVAIGPLGFDLIRLSELGDPFAVLEQFARLTVGLAVMAAALRLPAPYFRENARAMGAVLVSGMISTWLVSGLLAYALLGVPLWIALLVGAIVTPTDPVLAGTIVTGTTTEENIPDSIRDLLTGESGANDGLAYPLVFLPIFALERPPGRALIDWLLEALLWDVGAAVAVGATVGAAAGLVEKKSREFLEETSLLTVIAAFTFAVLGGVKLLGSDGILAAFAAGLAFNRFADAEDEAEEQRVQESVLRLFTVPVFVLFGVAAPWERWLALGWTGVALAAGVLLLRRAPVVLSLLALDRPARDARRPLRRLVRTDRRRGPLLLDGRAPDDRTRGDLGGGQPRHREFGAGPRDHGDAAHETVRPGDRKSAERERTGRASGTRRRMSATLRGDVAECGDRRRDTPRNGDCLYPNRGTTIGHRV